MGYIRGKTSSHAWAVAPAEDADASAEEMAVWVSMAKVEIAAPQGPPPALATVTADSAFLRRMQMVCFNS